MKYELTVRVTIDEDSEFDLDYLTEAIDQAGGFVAKTEQVG